MSIKINIDKVKNIAHERRRVARDKEMLPYDNIIMKQIPGNNLKQTEVERQKIRDKYTDIQIKIDSAKTPEEIKIIMSSWEK